MIIAAYEKEQFLKSKQQEEEAVMLTGAPNETILLRPKKPLPPPGPLFQSASSAPSDKYGVFRLSAGDVTKQNNEQARRELLMKESNKLQRLLGRATGDVPKQDIRQGAYAHFESLDDPNENEAQRGQNSSEEHSD